MGRRSKKKGPKGGGGGVSDLRSRLNKLRSQNGGDEADHEKPKANLRSYVDAQRKMREEDDAQVQDQNESAGDNDDISLSSIESGSPGPSKYRSRSPRPRRRSRSPPPTKRSPLPSPSSKKLKSTVVVSKDDKRRSRSSSRSEANSKRASRKRRKSKSKSKKHKKHKKSKSHKKAKVETSPIRTSSSDELSLSPSPEREPAQDQERNSKSRSASRRPSGGTPRGTPRASRSPPSRRHSRTTSRSPPPAHRQAFREDYRSYERFPPHRHYYRGRGHHSRRIPSQPRMSWEDKCEDFIKRLGDKVQQELAKKAGEEAENPSEQAEVSCDSIELTPLMKFVAKRLEKSRTANNLVFTGPFQYSLVSLLNRSQWVAAKSVQILERSGFDYEWLYENIMTKGADAIKRQLKNVVVEGKLDEKLDVEEVRQMNTVIGILVGYYSEDAVISEEDEQVPPGPEPNPEQKAEEQDHQQQTSGRPLKTGMAATLAFLSQSESQPQEQVQQQQQQQPQQPQQQQQQQQYQNVNHWSLLSDSIQASSLNSFEKLEGYLSQDLLRLTAQAPEDAKEFLQVSGKTATAFDVARTMVLCWVNSGYDFLRIREIVDRSEVDDILPPRDPNDQSKRFIQLRKPGMKSVLAHNFLSQFKTLMGQYLNDAQLDYVVWKSLVFVMRGLNKKPNTVNPQGSGMKHHGSYNVVYNYLPPGLREAEQGLAGNANHHVVNEMDNYQPEDNDNNMVSSTTTGLSEDPMNIIINPGAMMSKAGQLPRRKYFVGALHLDWVVVRGKPEIFEISLHLQDLSSLEVFAVTEALKKETTILEHLGFTVNTNLDKYYYVQAGMGCVSAFTMKKAMDKVVAFLEEKRHSSNENKNNGIVLLVKGKEELSVFLTALKDYKCNDLTLQTVKGFGLLNSLATLDGITCNLVGSSNEYCHTAQVTNVISKTDEGQIMSKSKSELLLKGLEQVLKLNPGYENFVQPYCFPSDSAIVKGVKAKAVALAALYELEVFVSAELRSNRVELHLEGFFQPSKTKDLRHKCDIVANRVCEALVDDGFTMTTLISKFRQNPLFVFDPDFILNKMDQGARLKVMNQTRACLDFVRHYFSTVK